MEEHKDQLQEAKEILAQKKFVQTIIGKGITFSVNYTTKVRPKGILGILKPKVNKIVHEEFTLKEPTLSTLDRASEVWLRWNTDDYEEEGAEVVKEGWKLVNRHAHDMAECIAILVLGEEYYAVDGGDDKELNRLTELFYHTVKPSQASDMSMFINATSNLVDFANSMRLMKMSATTTPTARIE